jgi:SAM-dependent methyltransferase
VTSMSDFDYDAELRLHDELFRGAAGVCPDDRVLDIGCGTGQSTREAARSRLRATIDAHATHDGVFFDSRSWIVTAARRS